MTGGKRALFALTVLMVVLAGGALAAWSVYLAPAQVLAEERAAAVSQIRELQSVLLAERRVAAGLADFGATTLGSDPDFAIHEFRARLSDLAASAGMSQVSVSTGSPQPASNPAGRARVGRSMQRLLREEPDFWVITAQLSASGSYASCLQTLAVVRAQPWAHRVDRVVIRPEGPDRSSFKFTLHVATAFVPDLGGDVPAAAAVTELDADAVQRLAQANPFVTPPKPVVAAQPATPAPKPRPAPPPAPPTDRWRVVGIVESGQIEVWLERTDTGETRVLHPGETLLGWGLQTASGEQTEWLRPSNAGGGRVRVAAGQSLKEGVPVGSRSE